MHEASLICINCRRHNGWLGKFTCDAVLCDAAVGARQPISLRQIEDEMALRADQSSSDDMKGALFFNKRKKEGDKQPDFEGPLVVDGIARRLAAWKKENSSGLKWLSLKVTTITTAST
jgi:hypothetical protein